MIPRMKLLAAALLLAGAAARADIIFFVDNPSRDQRFEHSWGYFQKPSELELEAQKFPVTSERAASGHDSLRLHWTSGTNGDWGICVATAGWLWHDISTCDAIRFKVNAPEAISKDALPDLAIEDSNNHKSARVWLGNYCEGVDDDSHTWQDVVVPVDALKPGPLSCDKKLMKSVYFFQHAPDFTDHVMWIDDLRITQPGTPPPKPPATPEGVTAVGRDGRIDVRWKPNREEDILGYLIYRAGGTNGAFFPQNLAIHEPPLYSDDVQSNGVAYRYQVKAVNREFQESPPSAPVSAKSAAMDDKELVTYAQEAAFHYFYEYAHPVSGLARERKGSADVCAIGASGFGIMTLIVGADRGFAPREDVAARVAKIVRFLDEKAQRHHGAYPHWIHGATGETIPFSEWDDGGDLVETSYLVQGLLAARQYFDKDTPDEKDIRALATKIWDGVDWNFYRHGKNHLYRNWSSNYEWRMDVPITGFSDAQITYILAVASPSNAIPAAMYYEGWAAETNYANGHMYYDNLIHVGPELGGPLFFIEHSYLGFDPRNKHDRFCNYFENNRNIALVNRAYCIANPRRFKDYSDAAWGLSACDDPSGYNPHSPKKFDNGTLAPSAVISAMPYVPKESVLTLRNMYHKYGSHLWGEFGFRSGFCPAQDWYAKSYVGIELGTVAPMIENARSGLCWKLFMANPEIQKALKAIGFVDEK